MAWKRAKNWPRDRTGLPEDTSKEDVPQETFLERNKISWLDGGPPELFH